MPKNNLYPPTKSATLRNEQRSEKVLEEFAEQNPKVAAEVYSGRDLQNTLTKARAVGKSGVASSSEWADRQVAQQLNGMGTSRFEVGVLIADKAKASR